MATKELRYGPKGKRETGRWRARAKLDWQEYYLGLFDSEDEAKAVEEAFRAGK